MTEMPAAAGLLLAVYLTYPHVDRQHTGKRSAQILERVLERGRPTHRVIHRIPFLLPLNFQVIDAPAPSIVTEPSPCSAVTTIG